MADSKQHDNVEQTEEEFSKYINNVVVNGFTSTTIAMGIETGIIDAMVAAEPTPKSCQELADAANLKERYVREWLGSMVSSGIVEYDAAVKTYLLPKQRHCIKNLLLSFVMPCISAAFYDVAESFKKDGPSGVHYDKYPAFDDLMNKFHGPLFKRLCSSFFPTMPDVQNKLESGIKVLDIGSGPGTSTIDMAKGFPKSHFYGLDFSANAIKSSEEKAKEAGLTNTTFVCIDISDLPPDWTGQFDYAFAHMVIHDLASPVRTLKEIRRALSRDGVLSVIDPNASSKLEVNATVAKCRVLYTLSMLNCVPTSLHAGGDGAALGAVVGREKMTEVLEESGFQVRSEVCTALDGSLHYICTKSA